MQLTVSAFVVWIIVGMLAGSLAGIVVKRKKAGFGWYANFGIGLAGALIGGGLFDIFRIDLGLANISVSLQDIVSAFVGSLLFLAILVYGRRWYQKKAGKAQISSSSE